MKAIAMLALCVSLCAAAATTPEISPVQIHSIMFLVTINKATGVWTHGQMVAGFKDYDACHKAVPVLAATAAVRVTQDPDVVPVFLCPEIDLDGIKHEQDEAQKKDVAPPAPPLDQDTREPSTAL